jgi:hypothetical protein
VQDEDRHDFGDNVGERVTERGSTQVAGNRENEETV